LSKFAPVSAARAPGRRGRNDRPRRNLAMAGVALRHLQGWDTTPISKEALKQRQARAIAHGASQ